MAVQSNRRRRTSQKGYHPLQYCRWTAWWFLWAPQKIISCGPGANLGPRGPFGPLGPVRALGAHWVPWGPLAPVRALGARSNPFGPIQNPFEHIQGPFGAHLGPLVPFGPIWTHSAHLDPIGPAIKKQKTLRATTFTIFSTEDIRRM